MNLVAEDLDEISAHVQNLGWIGPDESIDALSSAGAGNMNRTLRARIGNRSMILKQSVPFVAKYPDIPAPEQRIEIEALFYQAIAGRAPLAARVPRVIGFDVDNHLLCLEDLGAAKDFTDLYEPGNGTTADARMEQLVSLIDWLGALHAMPRPSEQLAGGLHNAAMRELNHAHIFEIPLDADNGLPAPSGLAEVTAEFAADITLKAAAGRLGAVYLGAAPHRSDDVLLHGDFYPGSWLQHPTLGAMVIDPEFAFLGAPEFDMGVLLAHLTMCRLPPAQLQQLRRRYIAPRGFDDSLMHGFTGIEIIRRLLGVAKLPLDADSTTQRNWLASARAAVLESGTPQSAPR